MVLTKSNPKDFKIYVDVDIESLNEYLKATRLKRNALNWHKIKQSPTKHKFNC